MAKTKLDVLEGAYEIISDRERWTQGALARNAAREAVDPRFKSAQSFCAIGAIDRVARTSLGARRLAVSALTEALGGKSIALTNDGPRGRVRILAAFRRAIKKARAAS